MAVTIRGKLSGNDKDKVVIKFGTLSQGGPGMSIALRGEEVIRIGRHKLLRGTFLPSRKLAIKSHREGDEIVLTVGEGGVDSVADPNALSLRFIWTDQTVMFKTPEESGWTLSQDGESVQGDEELFVLRSLK